MSEQLRREALRELAIAYGPTQDASLARAQLSELRKAVLDFLAAAPSTPGVVTHADYDHSRGCQYCGTGPEPNDAS